MSHSQSIVLRARMTYSFRFLDNIALADLAFEASGDSLQDVFRAATDAMIEAMANPVTVGRTWQQALNREDPDPSSLLFEWLSDLVYW